MQLVALKGIGTTARTSSPCRCWRFPSFASGSELCKAQETRGSKFTREFGRNSTVYCFVASGNKVQLHSQKTKFISLSQSLNQYNLKYINFMHKYTANIPKILTLCDYCDKLLTRLEIIVSFIMSLKTKYGGK